MKSLVKEPGESGLVLTDVPDPHPGRDDVVIKVLRTGICGTDLHIYSWDRWAQGTVPAPLVIGHEFVGEIIETGPDVTDFAPGDLVSGEGHLVCGKCRNCMAGRRHMCAATDSVGVTRPGAFAEYLALPASNVWRHRAQGGNPVDLDVAAVFDPLGNAVHTALAYPLVGEDVLITGAGPVGLMATAVARRAGARHVVVTDPGEYRLQLAHDVGADLAVDVRNTDLTAAQRTIGMREGFDVALEMSGTSAALQDILNNVVHGGRIAMLGLPESEFAIDFSRVVLNMLTIRGIYGREMFETWHAMAMLVEQGLDISPAITHRFACTDFEQAFATAQQGQCGKVLLDWS